MARDGAAPEAELAPAVGKKPGEDAARAPAAVKSIVGRLGPLNFTALILDALRNTGVEVLEQRQRIGRIASYETSCPFLQPFGWIRILRDGQCTKVSPFVIGVAEWV